MCLNFFIKHKITNFLELLFYCRKKFKQLLYHNHWVVIPALRISIEENNSKKICFYNKYLASFWENIHRPITSWSLGGMFQM